MAWKNYDNMFGAADAARIRASGDKIEITEFVENAQGTQSEFEERSAAYRPDVGGVIEGFAPTDDGTNIDVAAGVIYTNGYKAKLATSISVTGSAADDYYAYVDSSATSPTYAISTTIPIDEDIVLAKFTWNGTDTITNFADIRQFGVDIDYLRVCSQLETTAMTTFDDKIVGIFVAPRACCIRRPYLTVYETGDDIAGTIVLDVSTGTKSSNSSIYSAAGLKPTINYSDADGTTARGDIPDTAYRLVSAGQLIIASISVTDCANAAGLYITIPVTYY